MIVVSYFIICHTYEIHDIKITWKYNNNKNKNRNFIDNWQIQCGQGNTLIVLKRLSSTDTKTQRRINTSINKAIRDGKYLTPPHASAWQRSPH